jgi:hypothetical protein
VDIQNQDWVECRFGCPPRDPSGKFLFLGCKYRACHDCDPPKHCRFHPSPESAVTSLPHFLLRGARAGALIGRGTGRIFTPLDAKGTLTAIHVFLVFHAPMPHVHPRIQAPCRCACLHQEKKAYIYVVYVHRSQQLSHRAFRLFRNFASHHLHRETIWTYILSHHSLDACQTPWPSSKAESCSRP